jgi:hypothetical protein
MGSLDLIAGLATFTNHYQNLPNQKDYFMGMTPSAKNALSGDRKKQTTASQSSSTKPSCTSKAAYALFANACHQAIDVLTVILWWIIAMAQVWFAACFAQDAMQRLESQWTTWQRLRL